MLLQTFGANPKCSRTRKRPAVSVYILGETKQMCLPPTQQIIFFLKQHWIDFISLIALLQPPSPPPFPTKPSPFIQLHFQQCSLPLKKQKVFSWITFSRNDLKPSFNAFFPQTYTYAQTKALVCKNHDHFWTPTHTINQNCIQFDMFHLICKSSITPALFHSSIQMKHSSTQLNDQYLGLGLTL